MNVTLFWNWDFADTTNLRGVHTPYVKRDLSRWSQTQERRPCEDGGGDWSNGATNWEMPRIRGNLRRLGRGLGHVLPQCLGKDEPCQHSHSWHLASKMVRINFRFLKSIDFRLYCFVTATLSNVIAWLWKEMHQRLKNMHNSVDWYFQKSSI